MFFTFPTAEVEGCSYKLLPLEDAAGTASKRPRLALQSEDLPDESASHVAVAEQCDLIAFRVLHGNAANLKYAPLPVASKPFFNQGSTVVALHNIVFLEDGQPCVDLGATAALDVLLDLDTCSPEMLRTCLQRWQLPGNMKYMLPCPHAMKQGAMQFVTAFLDAKAVPDELYTIAPAVPQEVHKYLCDQGFAQVVQNGQTLLTRLTEKAMKFLSPVSVLKDPQPVCSLSRSKVEDMGKMELMLELERNGWQFAPLPKATAERSSLLHLPDSEKVWYGMSHTFSIPYLQCLVKSDALFKKGISAIPHWVAKPRQVYPALLQGKKATAPAVFDLQPEVLAGEEFALEGGEVCAEPGDSEDDLLQELEELMDNAVEHEMGASSSARLPDLPPVPEGGLQSEPKAAVDLAADHPVSCEDELTQPSKWGPFRLTPRQPAKGRPHGGFEANCPFHRKNANTGCKKYIQLRDGSDEMRTAALRALQSWCNSAPQHKRQRTHLCHYISIETAPSQVVVAAGKITNPPAEKAKTDEELDEADAASAKPKPCPARGKGRGGSKAARGGRGRGRKGAGQGCLRAVGFV